MPYARSTQREDLYMYICYHDVVQKEMLEARIIEPSESEWAFPVALARKKDGALWI